MNTRRDFLKKTCGLCIALGGVGFVSTLLESCATVPMVKATETNKKISIPLNSFNDKKPFVLIRVFSLENDILLYKKSENDFVAILMQCTHEKQPLSLSGTGLHCSAHGSSFDLEGNVTQSPALLPLKKYPATLSGEVIIIELNK